jgi:AraC family transcriptional regulator, transcriptional activator FtrA
MICYCRKNLAMKTSKRHHVVTLVAAGSGMFELSVAVEIFGVDPELGVPWYRFTAATPEPGTVRLDGGIDVLIPHGIEALRTANTIIVTAGWPPGETYSDELLDALRRAHRRGARIVSFCTGTFLLAEAGLLDGRTATTHWNATERFAARYPNVEIDSGVLYVDHGDVMTSAGMASAIDLAIHIVRTDHGAHIANLLARQTVVAPHRHGGQAQFITAPAAPACEADNLGSTIDWMLEHLGDDLPLAAVARHANLSMRQFSRRFLDTMGVTPHQWLIRQRVLRAQELLEQGVASVEEVATRCGFQSAAAMRPHFLRIVTTTPAEYRRCFANC